MSVDPVISTWFECSPVGSGRSVDPVVSGCVGGCGGVLWKISVDPVISMWLECLPIRSGRSLDPVIS